MIYVPEPWDQIIEESARLSLDEYWDGYSHLTEKQIDYEIETIYQKFAERYTYGYVRKLFNNKELEKLRDVLVSLCVQLTVYQWLKTNKFHADPPKHTILGLEFAKRNLKLLK